MNHSLEIITLIYTKGAMFRLGWPPLQFFVDPRVEICVLKYFRRPYQHYFQKKIFSIIVNILIFFGRFLLKESEEMSTKLKITHYVTAYVFCDEMKRMTRRVRSMGSYLISDVYPDHYLVVKSNIFWKTLWKIT